MSREDLELSVASVPRPALGTAVSVLEAATALADAVPVAEAVPLATAAEEVTAVAPNEIGMLRSREVTACAYRSEKVDERSARP